MCSSENVWVNTILCCTFLGLSLFRHVVKESRCQTGLCAVQICHPLCECWAKRGKEGMQYPLHVHCCASSSSKGVCAVCLSGGCLMCTPKHDLQVQELGGQNKQRMWLCRASTSALHWSNCTHKFRGYSQTITDCGNKLIIQTKLWFSVKTTYEPVNI